MTIQEPSGRVEVSFEATVGALSAAAEAALRARLATTQFPDVV